MAGSVGKARAKMKEQRGKREEYDVEIKIDSCFRRNDGGAAQGRLAG